MHTVYMILNEIKAKKYVYTHYDLFLNTTDNLVYFTSSVHNSRTG